MKVDSPGGSLKRPAILLACITLLAAWRAELSSQAGDVSVYFVKKGFEYTQTDFGLPSINATNGNGFEANVVMSLNNLVTNATVQPGALPANTLTLSASQNKLVYKHKYNTLTALDTHYPNGPFAMMMQGRNDGTRTVTLQLLGNVYPNAPWISNFNDTQAINPNGYFQVTWGAFGGGTANDYIQFRIEDLAGNKLLETPDLGLIGGLDGTATRVVVAPGYLTTGPTNRATLLFHKAVAIDTTSYPGALGEAAYYTRTTAYVVSTAAAAPDVKTFEVSKRNRWLQTGSNSLALEPGQEYGFDATVKAYNTGILTTATVQLPPTTNAPSRNLLMQPGGTTLDFADYATTLPALDAFYGTGTYTFQFGTPHDGSKSLNLTLPADAFPPAPRVANFNAAQTINVSHPFTIAWDPWAGGSINDFIHVRIEDLNFNKIWETPDLGKNGALDGRATNAVVPAGTLPVGQPFEIHITFIKLNTVDTTSYRGVLGLSDFQTRTKVHTQTIAIDVQSYNVFKRQLFQQTDSGAPVALSSNAFRFESQVQAMASNSVAAASVLTPLGARPSLVQQPDPRQFDLSAAYSTKSGLDAVYPNGSYTLDVNAASDGPKNLPLALAADQYPNAPHVIDFYAGQMVDSSSDFVLAWDSFAGGTANDFIQLVVNDAAGNIVFQTPGFGVSGALDGFVTGTIIPGGIFHSNQLYNASLLFEKIVVLDTNTYPGAQGIAGYSASTQFRLVTRGPGDPATLSLSQNVSNRQFQLTAQVVAGLSYRLDGSSNLVQWLPLGTNIAVSNTLQWLDSSNRPAFFYRTAVLP